MRAGEEPQLVATRREREWRERLEVLERPVDRRRHRGPVQGDRRPVAARQMERGARRRRRSEVVEGREAKLGHTDGQLGHEPGRLLTGRRGRRVQERQDHTVAVQRFEGHDVARPHVDVANSQPALDPESQRTQGGAVGCLDLDAVERARVGPAQLDRRSPIVRAGQPGGRRVAVHQRLGAKCGDLSPGRAGDDLKRRRRRDRGEHLVEGGPRDRKNRPREGEVGGRREREGPGQTRLLVAVKVVVGIGVASVEQHRLIGARRRRRWCRQGQGPVDVDTGHLHLSHAGVPRAALHRRDRQADPGRLAPGKGKCLGCFGPVDRARHRPRLGGDPQRRDAGPRGTVEQQLHVDGARRDRLRHPQLQPLAQRAVQ